MKILLITHNPTTTNNNMGKTFLSLFSAFERNELCQLYVHPTIPDVDACHSYFRITDRQVLRTALMGSPGGEISREAVARQVSMRENGTLPPPPPRGGSSAWRRMLRDTVWKLSNWYSGKLKKWLDQEKPTCIFLAPGYARFIYDVALRIAKDYDLPIVTYICDDYYFVDEPDDLLGRKQLAALQKKTERLMERTSRLVVISEETKQAYQSHFGVDTDVLMTGATVPRARGLTGEGEIRNISYLGNLGAGRQMTLADIGRALDEINRDRGTALRLRIYTSETAAQRLQAFDGISSVELCGFVSGKAFEDAFADADMLVHTESFDPADMDLVKHSVSTKIADALACGIPMLAYGPAQISSMQHLIRNECAVVATSPADLRGALEDVLTHSKKIEAVVEHAVQTAAQYHDKKKNSERLRAIFAEAEEKHHE